MLGRYLSPVSRTLEDLRGDWDASALVKQCYYLPIGIRAAASPLVGAMKVLGLAPGLRAPAVLMGGGGVGVVPLSAPSRPDSLA